MSRQRPLTPSLLAAVVLTALAFAFDAACVKKGGKAMKDPTAQNSGENGEGGSQIKLKGANLLAQSLFRTFGANKDVQPRAQNGRDVRLFDTYAQNFGNTDGLRFGEIYPDSPSTSYFLALAIVADNAARQCQSELAGNPTQSLCRCATPEDAKAMLDRAFPFLGFASGAHPEMVKAFQERCQTDYVGAVSSLISSLAFAVRQ